ncbi:MAG: PhoH family protein [Thermodesulfovibrionales bacterium]|nr:PhoH family protein [Thermodesulfovibrionales bacterium]
MKKIFVLDTNVLIHDPDCIFKFEENDVVIPIAVIEELDKFKKWHFEIAYSARQALKNIDSLRENGNLAMGVPLKRGGSLTVMPLPYFSDDVSTDNKIIKTALHVMNNANKNGYRQVILISKDTAVRIKSESLGLYTEDYKNDKTTHFIKYGSILSEQDYANGIHSVRYVQKGESIYRLQGEDKQVKIKRGKTLDNIVAKNIEQECAIDALTSPDIEIVVLTGPAGTGKTALSLAAGLHQTTKKSPLYEQVLVARPIIPLGNDLGYLPGDIEDKLAPWMQPIFDNLQIIVNNPSTHIREAHAGSKYKSYQYLIESGILHIEALAYLRGRSLPYRYFIVDEAQNLRPLDIKTIITRCGEGTKIVFTGDLNQIDTPYLDAMSNGLSYLISRFINEENFCYLNMKTSVRSRLAEQGARLLQSFSRESVILSSYE